MAHVVRPAGDGFRITNVWSTPEVMRRFHDEVLLPFVTAAELLFPEPLVSPVWSFTRP